MMATNTLPHESPQALDTSSSQYPSTPPAALTIVLSVACGAVATCILLTIILLLLRHRSGKQAFGQEEGEHASCTDKSSSGPDPDLGEMRHGGGAVAGSGSDGGSGGVLGTSGPAAVTVYLPVLHSGDSRTTPTRTTYPKRVYLGLSRTGMSTPWNNIV
ncbi:hypothetical protein BJV74DRAFT_545657 [Russula compacta]|nr:hypothetical protein BJV74DRAFT_545657 [Russula compacta]